MMTRYLILVALRWLPVGVLIPVSVLLPLDRGLGLDQVGMLAAVQGVTVLLLELPTGGLADALGRRPVLIAAGVVELGALGLLLVAHSVPAFFAFWLLQGVYRALDSGPLDAWYVDRALAADPDAAIETGLSRGGAVLGFAVAGGALLGGGLVALGPIGPFSALTGPVLAALVLHVGSLLGLTLLMTEERPARGLGALAASIRGVPVAIGGALRLARGSRAVTALLAVEFLWTLGMASFEQLTPVRLAELLDDPRGASAVMGPVSSAAWAASALGAALVPLLVRRVGARWAGVTLRLVHGGAVAAMALTGGVAGLIIAFLFCYAVHGAANPVHSGLLHRLAGERNRASLISLNSMAGQPGGALGLVVLTAIAAHTSVPAAMLTGAAVLAVAAPLYLAVNVPQRSFSESALRV